MIPNDRIRPAAQNGLGFDVQTGEGQGQIGTVATHGVHGDLQGGWRWFSLNVVDSYPVRSRLVEFDGGKVVWAGPGSWVSKCIADDIRMS